MKIFATIASSLLLMLVITACGGGSSPTPVAANTTVSGIASKGPIVNGVVKIYSVIDGAKSTLLAQTTTDANGNYTANLGSYVGPIIVEASGSYLDEATGTTKTIPADSPIHAALPLAQGAVNLPVTALTELAYIKTGGDLTASAISTANTLVSDLFKVDIIATSPVAPTTEALKTATQAEKDYTLALAAISQMASTTTGASDTDKLNNALSTMGQGISSTGMTSDTAATVQAALTTFVTTNANNNTGVSDTSTTSLVNIGTLSKSYKLVLQGTSTPGSVTGLQFNISLPAGVTVNVNSLTSAVLASSLALSSNPSSSSLLAAKYSPGSLNIGIVNTSGFSVGDVATLTCNIPAGVSVPEPSAFTVTNLKSIDKLGATVTGATITVN
ncbi:hypothetical protein [Geotalea uraniireducens]|uniref:Carboxypeptidase regulatory-like domain-containing protein n=1 Tax=Geotalea uraniireducens (strain Rf4) TaxID=351605 RepID=A5GBS9_GEOUR|nr:hypothetical protein [Geotalea uraniireducens]ABQ24966.1 hypothetical protein Gura_0757 [Geotalea uraniireducens Rf4]